MLRHARALILLPLALIAGGCGGGGGATTAGTSTPIPTTAQTPSKAATPGGNAGKALVAAADPLCKAVAEKRVKANEELEAAAKAGSPTKLLATLAKTAPTIAGYERHALTGLRALKAPTALARDWRTMLTLLQRIESNTVALGLAAKANNNKRGEALTTSSKQIESEVAAIGIRDGFTYCGPSS